MLFIETHLLATPQTIHQMNYCFQVTLKKKHSEVPYHNNTQVTLCHNDNWSSVCAGTLWHPIMHLWL